MSRLVHPVRVALWLAALAGLVAVGDAVVTALGRHAFNANADAYGWAIVEQAPYDGTRQRFVFCLAVVVVVAAAAVAGAVLVTRPRPTARLTVVTALPVAVLLDLFAVVYSPDNVGESQRGVSAAARAEGTAAFERLFPLWYTGGHALAVGLLAILTVSLLLALRKPAARDYFEFQDPDGLRPTLLRRPG